MLYTSGQIPFFKSADGAKTWTPISAVYEGQGYVVDPRTPTTLYGLSGPQGATYLVKSVDGGNTWTLSTSGLGPYPEVNDVAVNTIRKQILYAVSDTSQGVFTSADGGATWASSGVGLPLEDEPTLVAVDLATPSHVYVVAGGSYLPNVLYVSDDSCAHWA